MSLDTAEAAALHSLQSCRVPVAASSQRALMLSVCAPDYAAAAAGKGRLTICLSLSRLNVSESRILV